MTAITWSRQDFTAITSISISHSGRASAVTVIPVDTACTPFNHRPMTRYMASR
jgi:hypothetical protein